MISKKKGHLAGRKAMFERYSELPAMVNQAPFYQTIDMELVQVDKRGSVLRLKTEHKHLNLLGVIHGGALASLVDSACSLSLVPYLKEGQAMITLSLHVEYIASGSKGDLTGRGKVVHRSNRVIRAEAVIIDQTANLIAKGYATLIKTASHQYQDNCSPEDQQK